MQQQTIRLSDIIKDNQFQVRHAIDEFHVGTLKQILLAGQDFKDKMKLLPDGRIISGFHRFEAYKKVYDPQDTIQVEICDLNEEDAYLLAIRENANHGKPLQTWDKKNIRRSLQSMGYGDGDISTMLGISLDRFAEWDRSQVIVRKPNLPSEKKDVKSNVKLPQEVTEKQYESHVKNHAGRTAFHARRILVRLEDGTIEDDSQTYDVLYDLMLALDKHLSHYQEAK